MSFTLTLVPIRFFIFFFSKFVARLWSLHQIFVSFSVCYTFHADVRYFLTHGHLSKGQIKYDFYRSVFEARRVTLL